MVDAEQPAAAGATRTRIPVSRRAGARYAGAALAVLAASAAGPGAPAAAAGGLEGPLWQAVFVAGADGRLLPVLLGSEVTATFQGGRVSGSAGCNRFTAGYTLDAPTPGSLRLTPVASTQALCTEPAGVMEQEAAFVQALQRSVRYNAVEHLLLLQSAIGRVLLAFVPQPQPTLEGTEWSAIDFNNTQAVTSLIPGTRITAAFAGGRLSGSAGCNRYTAAYTVAAGSDALTIGPAASTRILCTEPAGVMEQEAAYLAALATVQTYRLERGDLIMERDGGVRVATFAPTAG